MLFRSAGHTIGELDIRRRYHVNVLGIKEKGRLTVEITPATQCAAGDTVLVVGHRKDLTKFFHI